MSKDMLEAGSVITQKRRFRVLIAHNYYQQSGGEDVVVANEHDMLVQAGHDVDLHCVHNDEIQGFRRKLKTFYEAPYSNQAYRQFVQRLDRLRPEVVHVHNYFPLLTPSVFFACYQRRIPVVHTLHNFRMVCSGGQFLRDGKICEKCLGRSPYWGVIHRCYRDSFGGSFAVARMIKEQRRLNWSNTVQRFIALTNFGRNKFIEAGLAADRVVVKPNFLPDPNVHSASLTDQRSGAFFVGRLSPEKGVLNLLEAWRRTDYPLRIAGDGPLAAILRSESPENVTFLGPLPREKVFAEMAKAAFLVLPSTWYEGFPMTLVEAFACGLPVVASRIGSLEELVDDGKTGLLFNPGDVDDLARTVAKACALPEKLTEMSRNVRRQYENCYTKEKNLERLLKIYNMACVRAE